MDASIFVPSPEKVMVEEVAVMEEIFREPPTLTSVEKMPEVPEKLEEPPMERLEAEPPVKVPLVKVPVETVGFANITLVKESMLKAGEATFW